MAKQPQNAEGRRAWIYKAVLLGIWAVILIICFLNRDRFTVDGVLAYSPRNATAAAVFLLFLFALKSLSVFLFSGILFAASGLLFPLPAAIGLNVLGAGIMVSLPYWIGRRMGRERVDQIVRKYPKAEALWNLRTGRTFRISFVTRVVNVLPSDILSLCLGAVGLHYGKYLAGSLLGMALSIVTFPIMGMNLTNPRSPAFFVSLGVQVAVSVISIGGCWLCHRKKTGGAPHPARPFDD